MSKIDAASMAIAEMREFAGFDPCEQRFIRRSLDVGLGRCDAFKVWARDAHEAAEIRCQYVAYQQLKALRADIPDPRGMDVAPVFLGTLGRVIASDLAQGRLRGFAATRFLYERLLGAAVRPWLPSAFCAAAPLPQIAPRDRKLLLQSLSEAAATARGWSMAQPGFFPEYIAAEAA